VEPPKSGGGGEIVWVFVPDLTGQTGKAAEAMLRDQHLTVGSVSWGVASVPAGTVFWQLPPPNTKVVQGSRVDVRIAQTPSVQPYVVVPDLFHQDIESAKSLLRQKGLQLGQVATEESGDLANLILSQSPSANTQVALGSSVDVRIAQPIAPVSVPDIVRREETDAIHILQGVGLRLGTVQEKESDQPTGTVLLQQPVAGAQVLKGTDVDVTLSRQTQLTVMVDPANPAKGASLQFHAHLEPPQKGTQYRFFFGDGEDSGWLRSANTTYIYRNGGNFLVHAIATRGETTITSEEVTVTISSLPWGSVTAGIAIGIVLLGGVGLYHQRLVRFRRWIRVAPKMDPGIQTVSLEGSKNRSPGVRIRLMHDLGSSRVLLQERQDGKTI
jgi:beta-lactam-binding protein with PASTA domain